MRKGISALLIATAFVAGGFTIATQAQETSDGAMTVKPSAPGFYRTRVGDIEVTALSDGTVKLPVDKLLALDSDEVQQRLSWYYQQAPLETSVNGYLINTGDELILIDSGAGSLFGPTLGYLAKNLQASGYSTADVDKVFITHMHPDHLGGLVNEGKAVFPNATVYVEQHDADFWLSEEKMAQAGEGDKGFFQGAMAAVKPYQEAGQLQTFTAPAQLSEHVLAQKAYGHTPGHTVYQVTSGGDKLVVIGDLIHVAGVQFDDPAVTIAFDSNPNEARQARLAEFADAARNGFRIAGAHLQFPGIGRLRVDNKGYRWIPVNYSPMWK
ncbi:MBL fold metallo-hydrolase [Idiomarina tyrosinivorans]|uniref:MBL fold metallo-hydrolase n=1 Tax=Idiomarina tyrosinivorans TaxID=1445662 RepID=A0A432ZRM9_9GAMM|nr:MBL fold metallo-hydrolase [Idiomarina tyrosinivorans]RUO80486.1 MBL fold metallo-hydrolase [Idiomarina tyrosinivorans]